MTDSRDYKDLVTEARHQASQENCDGDPYDLLIDMADMIERLRVAALCLRELSDGGAFVGYSARLALDALQPGDLDG